LYYSLNVIQFNLLIETTLQKTDKKVEALLRELPDQDGARPFYERLAHEQKRVVDRLLKQEGLLSDVLALAAWSPLLAMTLVQHADYINWLSRERANARVRTREELLESLARFSLMNSQLDPHVLLTRFRRRELLRIYLRDIRRTNTLVEITEELSNLADAILEHALRLSQQQLENHYGMPLKTDEKGRTAPASFCIVALGKLGSCELNYASDIDLLFLYSEDGTTSGHGARGETTNRQYFVKLAETVTKLVGKPTGEGAAYRVDLRLRPHGRDGVLASSLSEAVRYYREKAQAWELQAMLRARASAGDSTLFSKFAEAIENKVFAPDVTVAEALANVRLSKQKIDRHHAHDREGFNVKLGKGGIREIEFIAQALQLAFGGRDKWLHAPHTLVSLGRLAERGLITERERMDLFAAYNFLRLLEHRLQMENGLQTHSVPENEARRLIVAKRVGFTGKDALVQFNQTLETHTNNVQRAFERVFGADSEEEEEKGRRGEEEKRRKRETYSAFCIPHSAILIEPVEIETTAINSASEIFARYLSDDEKLSQPNLFELMREAANNSLNRRRASLLTSRVAASLEKSDNEITVNLGQLETLVKLCGVSEFFGEMVATNPALISTLPNVEDRVDDSYRALLKKAVLNTETYGAEMAVMRRIWSRLFVEIGTLDALGAIEMREANRLQTELAEASLDAACLIARREMERRYGPLDAEFRVAVLGLGRLGGRGMDYGSDLDVTLVFDDQEQAPFSTLSAQEAYSRFAEIFVAALSSLTREGAVYRVDLRLRPDGKNGPVCSSASAFLNYLKERAAVWEWLANVKLRCAAGEKDLGQRVEDEARRIIHAAAKNIPNKTLRAEARRVRELLEKEKARKRGGGFAFDIKYGAGGMLDVYFATRYLQLRDNVPDERMDRSTVKTIERLREVGSLTEENYLAMKAGYAFLRQLDHNLRIVVGRSSRLPATDHPALTDIARRMGYETSQSLVEELAQQTKEIRSAYKRIME
jgi:glutamate-ammonia-ligase adenylyltransferase